MRPIRRALVIALLAASSGHATAQDGGFIWQSGFGQGTMEAFVPNVEGSEFHVYCRGGSDGNAGLTITLQGAAGTASNDTTQLVLVVDGAAEGWEADYTLEGGTTVFDIEAFNAPTMGALDDFVERLMGGETLAIEAPAVGIAESFSLRDSSAALSGLMEPCVQAKM